MTKSRALELNIDLLIERFYVDPTSESGLRMRVRSGAATHNPKLIRNPGDVAGFKNQDGYWEVCAGQKVYLKVSRIIWILSNGQIPDGIKVDHMDCDTLNNDLANLQLVTNGQNLRALSGPYACNKSGFLGVFPRPNNSWAAAMRRNGYLHYLGTFSSKVAAAKAYNAGVIAWAKEHGEEPRYLNPV